MPALQAAVAKPWTMLPRGANEHPVGNQAGIALQIEEADLVLSAQRLRFGRQMGRDEEGDRGIPQRGSVRAQLQQGRPLLKLAFSVNAIKRTFTKYSSFNER